MGSKFVDVSIMENFAGKRIIGSTSVNKFTLDSGQRLKPDLVFPVG